MVHRSLAPLIVTSSVNSPDKDDKKCQETTSSITNKNTAKKKTFIAPTSQQQQQPQQQRHSKEKSSVITLPPCKTVTTGENAEKFGEANTVRRGRNHSTITIPTITNRIVSRRTTQVKNCNAGTSSRTQKNHNSLVDSESITNNEKYNTLSCLSQNSSLITTGSKSPISIPSTSNKTRFSLRSNSLESITEKHKTSNKLCSNEFSDTKCKKSLNVRNIKKIVGNTKSNNISTDSDCHIELNERKSLKKYHSNESVFESSKDATDDDNKFPILNALLPVLKCSLPLERISGFLNTLNLKNNSKFVASQISEDIKVHNNENSDINDVTTDYTDDDSTEKDTHYNSLKSLVNSAIKVSNKNQHQLKSLCLYCDKSFSSHKFCVAHIERVHKNVKNQQSSSQSLSSTANSTTSSDDVQLHPKCLYCSNYNNENINNSNKNNINDNGSKSNKNLSNDNDRNNNNNDNNKNNNNNNDSNNNDENNSEINKNCNFTMSTMQSKNQNEQQQIGDEKPIILDDLKLLFNHMCNSHSDKYFACKLCTLRFQHSNQLVDHNTIYHKDNAQTKEFDSESSRKIDIIDDDDLYNKSNQKSGKNCLDFQLSQQLKIETDTSNSSNQPNTDFVEENSTSSNVKIALKTRRQMKQAIENSTTNSLSFSSLNTTSSSILRSNALLVHQNNILHGGDDAAILSRLGVAQNRLPRGRKGGLRCRRQNQTEFDNPPQLTIKTRSKVGFCKLTSTEIPSLLSESLSRPLVNNRMEPLCCTFDEDFYETVSLNVRKNLSCHLDGKLDSNPTAPCPISPATTIPTIRSTVIKSPLVLDSEIHEATTLAATTAFPTLLTAEQFGSDLQILSKIKRPITKHSWKWKWDSVKKYKYVNEGGKFVKKVKQPITGLRDLSKLDMWTQLTMRTKHELKQKELGNDLLSLSRTENTSTVITATTSEQDAILEFSEQAREAKRKQVDQLNFILDQRRLPQIILEQSEQSVIKLEPQDDNINDNITNTKNITTCQTITHNNDQNTPDKNSQIANDIENFTQILNLFRTENFQNNKINEVILSGEWARPRCYICCGCGARFDKMKTLEEHKMFRHPYVYSTHYEIVGRELIEGNLYKHLYIPVKALNRSSNEQLKVIRKFEDPEKKSIATLTSLEDESMDSIHSVSNRSFSIASKSDCDTDSKGTATTPTTSLSSLSSTYISTISASVNNIEDTFATPNGGGAGDFSRNCSKCKRECGGLLELYRHLLDCSGDYAWILAKKKKYRYFGTKRRKPVKHYNYSERKKKSSNSSSHEEGNISKQKYIYNSLTPRPPRPSDAESIRRMLENLPAKRACRKIIPEITKKPRCNKSLSLQQKKSLLVKNNKSRNNGVKNKINSKNITVAAITKHILRNHKKQIITRHLRDINRTKKQSQKTALSKVDTLKNLSNNKNIKKLPKERENFRKKSNFVKKITQKLQPKKTTCTMKKVTRNSSETNEKTETSSRKLREVEVKLSRINKCFPENKPTQKISPKSSNIVTQMNFRSKSRKLKTDSPEKQDDVKPECEKKNVPEEDSKSNDSSKTSVNENSINCVTKSTKNSKGIENVCNKILDQKSNTKAGKKNPSPEKSSSEPCNKKDIEDKEDDPKTSSVDVLNKVDIVVENEKESESKNSEEDLEKPTKETQELCEQNSSISPTTKRRGKKLNDCIAMLTGKLQEKMEQKNFEPKDNNLTMENLSATTLVTEVVHVNDVTTEGIKCDSLPEVSKNLKDVGKKNPKRKSATRKFVAEKDSESPKSPKAVTTNELNSSENENLTKVVSEISKSLENIKEISKDIQETLQNPVPTNCTVSSIDMHNIRTQLNTLTKCFPHNKEITQNMPSLQSNPTNTETVNVQNLNFSITPYTLKVPEHFSTQIKKNVNEIVLQKGNKLSNDLIISPISSINCNTNQHMSESQSTLKSNLLSPQKPQQQQETLKLQISENFPPAKTIQKILPQQLSPQILPGQQISPAPLYLQKSPVILSHQHLSQPIVTPSTDHPCAIDLSISQQRSTEAKLLSFMDFDDTPLDLSKKKSTSQITSTKPPQPARRPRILNKPQNIEQQLDLQTLVPENLCMNSKPIEIPVSKTQQPIINNLPIRIPTINSNEKKKVSTLIYPTQQETDQSLSFQSNFNNQVSKNKMFEFDKYRTMTELTIPKASSFVTTATNKKKRTSSRYNNRQQAICSKDSSDKIDDTITSVILGLDLQENAIDKPLQTQPVEAVVTPFQNLSNEQQSLHTMIAAQNQQIPIVPMNFISQVPHDRLICPDFSKIALQAMNLPQPPPAIQPPQFGNMKITVKPIELINMQANLDMIPKLPEEEQDIETLITRLHHIPSKSDNNKTDKIQCKKIEELVNTSDYVNAAQIEEVNNAANISLPKNLTDSNSIKIPDLNYFKDNVEASQKEVNKNTICEKPNRKTPLKKNKTRNSSKNEENLQQNDKIVTIATENTSGTTQTLENSAIESTINQYPEIDKSPIINNLETDTTSTDKVDSPENLSVIEIKKKNCKNTAINSARNVKTQEVLEKKPTKILSKDKKAPSEIDCENIEKKMTNEKNTVEEIENTKPTTRSTRNLTKKQDSQMKELQENNSKTSLLKNNELKAIDETVMSSDLAKKSETAEANDEAEQSPSPKKPELSKKKSQDNQKKTKRKEENSSIVQPNVSKSQDKPSISDEKIYVNDQEDSDKISSTKKKIKSVEFENDDLDKSINQSQKLKSKVNQNPNKISEPIKSKTTKMNKLSRADAEVIENSFKSVQSIGNSFTITKAERKSFNDKLPQSISQGTRRSNRTRLQTNKEFEEKTQKIVKKDEDEFVKNELANKVSTKNVDQAIESEKFEPPPETPVDELKSKSPQTKKRGRPLNKTSVEISKESNEINLEDENNSEEVANKPKTTKLEKTVSKENLKETSKQDRKRKTPEELSEKENVQNTKNEAVPTEPIIDVPELKSDSVMKKQRRRRRNELAAIVADQLLESFKEVDKSRIDDLKMLENLAYEKSEDLLLTGMRLTPTTKRKNSLDENKEIAMTEKAKQKQSVKITKSKNKNANKLVEKKVNDLPKPTEIKIVNQKQTSTPKDNVELKSTQNIEERIQNKTNNFNPFNLPTQTDDKEMNFKEFTSPLSLSSKTEKLNESEQAKEFPQILIETSNSCDSADQQEPDEKSKNIHQKPKKKLTKKKEKTGETEHINELRNGLESFSFEKGYFSAFVQRNFDSGSQKEMTALVQSNEPNNTLVKSNFSSISTRNNTLPKTSEKPVNPMLLKKPILRPSILKVGTDNPAEINLEEKPAIDPLKTLSNRDPRLNKNKNIELENSYQIRTRRKSELNSSNNADNESDCDELNAAFGSTQKLKFKTRYAHNAKNGAESSSEEDNYLAEIAKCVKDKIRSSQDEDFNFANDGFQLAESFLNEDRFNRPSTSLSMRSAPNFHDDRNGDFDDDENTNTEMIDMDLDDDCSVYTSFSQDVRRKGRRRRRRSVLLTRRRSNRSASVVDTDQTYDCQLCNKSFKKSGALAKHKMTIAHVSKVSAHEYFNSKAMKSQQECHENAINVEKKNTDHKEDNFNAIKEKPVKIVFDSMAQVGNKQTCLIENKIQLDMDDKINKQKQFETQLQLNKENPFDQLNSDKIQSTNMNQKRIETFQNEKNISTNSENITDISKNNKFISTRSKLSPNERIFPLMVNQSNQNSNNQFSKRSPKAVSLKPNQTKAFFNSINQPLPKSTEKNCDNFNQSTFSSSRLALNPEERLFYECCNMLKGSETPMVERSYPIVPPTVYVNSDLANRSSKCVENKIFKGPVYTPKPQKHHAHITSCHGLNFECPKEQTSDKSPLQDTTSHKNFNELELKPIEDSNRRFSNTDTNTSEESSGSNIDEINSTNIHDKITTDCPQNSLQNVKDQLQNHTLTSPTHSLSSQGSVHTSTTYRIKTKAAMKGYDNFKISIPTIGLDMQQALERSPHNTGCKLTALAEIALGNEDQPTISNNTRALPEVTQTNNLSVVDEVVTKQYVQHKPYETNQAKLIDESAESSLKKAKKSAKKFYVEKGKNAASKTSVASKKHSNENSTVEPPKDNLKKDVYDFDELLDSRKNSPIQSLKMTENKIYIPERPFENIGNNAANKTKSQSIDVFFKGKSPEQSLKNESIESTTSYSDRDDFNYNSMTDNIDEDDKDLDEDNDDESSSSDNSAITSKTLGNKSLIMGRIFKKNKTTTNVIDDRNHELIAFPEVQNEQFPRKMANQELDKIFDQLISDQTRKGKTKVNKNNDSIDSSKKTTLDSFSKKRGRPRKPNTLSNDGEREIREKSITDNKLIRNVSEVNSEIVNFRKPSTNQLSKTTKSSMSNKSSEKPEILKLQSELGMSAEEIAELIGDGKRKSQRRCAANSHKKHVEIWSSDEYEEFLTTKDILAIIEEREKKIQKKKRDEKRTNQNQSKKTTIKDFDRLKNKIDVSPPKYRELSTEKEFVKETSITSDNASTINNDEKISMIKSKKRSPQIIDKLFKKKLLNDKKSSEDLKKPLPTLKPHLKARRSDVESDLDSELKNGSGSEQDARTEKRRKILPLCEKSSPFPLPSSSKKLMKSNSVLSHLKLNERKNFEQQCHKSMSKPLDRRKRVASEMLYYWSSSSDEEFGRIAAREDDEDDGTEDGEHLQQHGWIVGDSHKKLVTLLAIAKGNKKVEDCGVKEISTKKKGT